MKSYLGQCIIAFAIMAHLVVNAIPVPSHDDLASPKLENPPWHAGRPREGSLSSDDAYGEDDTYDVSHLLKPSTPEGSAASQLPSSFPDFSFSGRPRGKPQGEPGEGSPFDIDAHGEFNGGYNLPSNSLQTTSIAKESPNIGFIESPSTTKPSSPQDTAPYRVDKKDFSTKDAKTLIIRMLNNQLELKEPSQFPWNKDGEWSDKVLRTVIEYMVGWQRYSVKTHKKHQAQGSKSSEPGRRTHTASPEATKRTAASSSLIIDVSSSTFKTLNRSRLNSYMDTLREWAVQQRASVANWKCLSAQEKVSKLDQDPKLRRTISEKNLIHLLLASVPPYNSAPPIDMSKMPWHVEATFRWEHPDDVKTVLSHIWTKQRRGASTFNRLNGSPEFLRGEMDDAWKLWIDQREKGKARRNKNRAARREEQAP